MDIPDGSTVYFFFSRIFDFSVLRERQFTVMRTADCRYEIVIQVIDESADIIKAAFVWKARTGTDVNIEYAADILLDMRKKSISLISDPNISEKASEYIFNSWLTITAMRRYLIVDRNMI